MTESGLLTRLRTSLFGFGSIAIKEQLHIRRDPTTLVFALAIPMVQLILFGFAINYDVRYVRTAVVDMDRSRESRDYVTSLTNTHFLEIVANPSSPAAALAGLKSGNVRAVVIIPPDFARRYGTASPPIVRALLDGSDSQVANPARSAFGAPRGKPAGNDIVETRIDVLFNPQMRTAVYTIPALIGVILQLITVSLTSFSLVREREQGTMEQLMVSPVGKLGLILGKLCPYAALALVELLVILVAGHVVFAVPMVGSVPLLILLSLPFILASLSIGLLISTLAQTQGQALQFTLLTTLPSVLLSGYIAPRETLPGPLYLLSNLIPVTYFNQILRGIIVRGAGFVDLSPNVAGLCILTALLLTLATMRFQKSLS